MLKWLSLTIHVRVKITEDVIVLPAGTFIWACFTVEPTSVSQNYWYEQQIVLYGTKMTRIEKLSWETADFLSKCFNHKWNPLEKKKTQTTNIWHFGLFLFNILESISAKKIPRAMSRSPFSDISPGFKEEQTNSFLIIF